MQRLVYKLRAIKSTTVQCIGYLIQQRLIRCAEVGGGVNGGGTIILAVGPSSTCYKNLR